jgi:hypothetical protein
MGEREAVKRYLDQLEAADNEDEVVIDNGAVGEALKKLQQNPEPEARFMRTTAGAGACLQRADGSRYPTLPDRGAAGDDGGQRQSQPAKPKGSCRMCRPIVP